MDQRGRRLRVSRLAAGIAATALVGHTLLAGVATADESIEMEVGPTAAEQRFAQEPRPLIELTASSGEGRLYTADIVEARRAVAEFGMTETPGVLGYLPRAEADGTIPVHRLKPRSDATAWLLSVNDDERTRLVDKGWVDEGVGAYVWTEDTATDDMIALARFRMPDREDWRIAPASRTDEFLDAGYELDGTLGYVYDDWIKAGAIYFPMWHEGGHHKESLCEAEYGRRDYWCGVRDFFDGHPNGADNWPDTDFGHLKPSIGYYDDSDPRTWEKHITQATSAGLSFFSAYWYWNGETQQEYSSDVGLAAFLQAGNVHDIDFTVAVCAHPWGPLTIPADQFPVVAETLVTKYLAQPNTLRANDGRKILSLCDTRGLGSNTDADIAAFIEEVRTQARDSLGEEIYVTISHGATDANRAPGLGADGAYCSTDGPAIEDPDQSYAKYVANQRGLFGAVSSDLDLMRCGMSNFDERTRYGVEISHDNKDEVRYFTDYAKDDFRGVVRNIREDMAESTRPKNMDNYALFFAWNEWDEGGNIEPNVRDGCFYLDAIRDGLGLKTGSGCVETPGSSLTADDQHVETRSGEPVEITLTGSGFDDETVTWTVEAGPEHGELTGEAPELVYTPAAEFTGDDHFAFTVGTDGGTSAPATVTITVHSSGDPEPPEEPGDEDGDSGTESGGESGTDGGNDDGSESAAEDGTAAGGDDGAENGDADGTESGTDEGTENGDDELPNTGAGIVVLAGAAALALIAAGAAGLRIRATSAH
ncbi:Ig-like domain-containing protein [Phytoactinopolyspora limicola]|uniref:Ig-like domain-containing protein n=1 Tax=Phytoactinopolyspora limicola TaxID=2715536 RepID=UPI001FEA0D4F|nr:glycoside hydrolase family 99-like domain-containing protein [Phytoactinopolyspora limicola]